MAGFTEQALQKKLQDLNNTLPSIQTLSLWLLHHRKHSAAIVKVWYNELKRERRPKKILNLLHLCNDVVQNSRKKWPLFQEQFQGVLEKAFGHAARHADAATLPATVRVIDVWRQRNVFDPNYVKLVTYAVTSNLSSELLSVYNNRAQKSGDDNDHQERQHRPAGRRERASTSSPHYQRNQSPAAAPVGDAAGGHQKRRRTESTAASARSVKNDAFSVTPPMGLSSSPENDTDNNHNSVDSLDTTPPSLSTEQQLINLRDPEDVIAQAPKTTDLTASLKSLEHPASADVDVRQRIAQYPADIADVSKLTNLSTQFQAERFAQVVQEADQLLKSYNVRLSQEMSDRTSILEQLKAYARAQKCLLDKDKQSLVQYKSQVEQLGKERTELRQHVESLPDMSKLPDVTRLPPLPSAGDLFTLT